MIVAEIETSQFSYIDTIHIERWCSEMLGPKAIFRDQVSDEYPWTVSSSGLGTYLWHFAHAESATLFALRWR